MANDFRIPASEIQNRITCIQKLLKENSIDALCILQQVDLFYFSGTAQNGILYIPADDKPLLFITKYYPRAKKESPLDDIIQIKSIREVPGLVKDYYGRNHKTLAFEFDVLPVRDFEYYKTLFNASRYADGSDFILNIRMIKSQWEIDCMEESARLSNKTFEYIRTVLQPGYTEIEFAGIYETFARKHGHEGILRARNYREKAYNWHILSGKNGGIVGMLDSPASGEGTSPAFPNGGGDRILAPNEPIMIDLGTALNGYHMDETRMFAIGSMPEKAFDSSKASIDIHNYVLDNIKPGVSLNELYEKSVSMAKLLGYGSQYLGPEGEKVIFIGHGIGLELVEKPIIAKGKHILLKPGMTFSLEPKMVFKNEFSTGIESVFTVTKTGYRMLSKVPSEIFIC